MTGRTRDLREKEVGEAAAGPLAGVRVVDLTSMVSGPMATAILGDQGADVIKVESPGSGDLIRHIGSSRGGMSAIFATVNRNKRSVVLNLREVRGKQLLGRLVAEADVFVQNFRPGVVDRMGIGEKDLRRVNADLVYASISGFGATGPYANRRVYDAVIQALSGMAAAQADPGGGEPVLVRNIVCDKVAAIHTAQAITAALFARERGAGGQHVRLSMLDAAVAFLWPDVMQGETYLGEGVSAPVPLHGLLSAHKTRDGYMTVIVISDVEFEGLCRALGRRELIADDRFRAMSVRMEHADELAVIIREHAGRCTTEELCSRLHAEGVPAAPINAPSEVHLDPQLVASGLLVELEHVVGGRLRVPGPVSEFEATPASIRKQAPGLGEHSDEVLAELGLSAAELGELRTQGVIA